MPILSTTTETLLYRPVPPRPDAVRMALAYPAPRNIALSSLGYLVLFSQLDQNPDVVAERLYSDTVEHHGTRDYELIGFSFAFELDALEILNMLERLGIPLYAKDRTADHPLIFAGGPTVMTNPEPFADFFDFFVIGEGEEILQELMGAYRQYRNITDRCDLLHRLSREVTGVYVPSLFEIDYAAPDGPIAAIRPRCADIPAVINKRMITDMENTVTSSPILSPETVFADTFLIEVMRGCAHRCRFCLASYSMLPARGATLEALIERIDFGSRYTNKVGLLGALIADHPQFAELCDYLQGKMDSQGLQISAASLRADTLTPHMAETFRKGGQKQVTIAIESGSETLRRRINKHLRQDAIFRATETVAKAGMRGIKLYGMVGLPDETEEDIEDTIRLMRELHRENPRLELHLGCSSFVPKAATPFQWQPRLETREVEHRFKMLQKGLLKVADFRPQSAKWDLFQAVLSRGDRRLAPFIERFRRLGGSLGSMNRAYKELRSEGVNLPPLDWYALRERPEDEILPWDMLSLGVHKEILYKEGLLPPGWKPG